MWNVFWIKICVCSYFMSETNIYFLLRWFSFSLRSFCEYFSRIIFRSLFVVVVLSFFVPLVLAYGSRIPTIALYACCMSGINSISQYLFSWRWFASFRRRDKQANKAMCLLQPSKQNERKSNKVNKWSVKS